MKSPLEDKPEILQEIGRFIVLFNLIDNELSLRFYYVINQTNEKHKPILDFLSSQFFSQKLEVVKNILGNDLYKEIYDLNEFRNHLGHGMYGMNSVGEVSSTKRNKSGKYSTKPISKEILEKEILKEREVLKKFYEMRLKNN